MAGIADVLPRLRSRPLPRARRDGVRAAIFGQNEGKPVQFDSNFPRLF
jgi:hypothetical protein